MTWTEDIVAEIRTRIEQLPHGSRSAYVEQVAENFGCSPATVRRRISDGSIKRKRDPEVPVEVIKKMMAMKAESELMGASGRQLATEDCIALMEQAGEIEPGSISQATADRRMRQMGFRQKRAYTRHEDAYVNQVHQMDFSRSEYFEVTGFADGDYLIKVDGRRGRYSYKNKPEEERLRLWVVSYVDTFSRASLFRYFASTGENLMMATQFLAFAWQRDDKSNPFIHLPEVLKLDQGAIGKNASFTRRLSEHLDIRVELAAPKNDRHAANQGMGKVERRFRSLWQRFELQQAYKLSQKGIKQITLQNLNDMVHKYAVDLLTWDHPVRNGTIGQNYLAGVRMREQKRLEVDIFNLLYTDMTRTVSAQSDISIDNQLYSVPEMYVMQKIRVYTTPDGQLMGSSMDRKDTFELQAFDPAMAQGSRAHTPTAKEQAAAQSLQLDGSKLSLANGNGEKPAGNVVHLPARESQLEAESPFTPKARPIDAFTDWFECRKYICSVHQCRWTDFNEQAQHLYHEMFETGKLTREIIDNLAQTAT